MRARVLFIVATILYFLIGQSCNSPTAEKNGLVEIEKRSDSSDDSSRLNRGIDPQALWYAAGSYYYEENWSFDHYEPKAGKLVGVWPDNWTSPRLSELYSIWGFRGILVYPNNDYNTALGVGFTTSNMMVAVSWEDYQSVVPNYPAFRYSAGERTDHACFGGPPYTQDRLLTMGNFIRSYGRTFGIDGYRRCAHFTNATSAVDFVMYSSYKNWNQWVSECWLPGSSDQRDSWSDMRNIFGSKFMSTWISGRVSTSTCGNETDIDSDEYWQLTGHANNLGLSEIWFFINCGTTQDELAWFTHWAWYNGWLRKFERKSYTVYECDCPAGCYSIPPGECWIPVGVQYTNVLREVFP